MMNWSPIRYCMSSARARASNVARSIPDRPVVAKGGGTVTMKAAAFVKS
jgi:hypothetical protein